MSIPPLSPAARLRWDATEKLLRGLPDSPRILETGAGSGAAGTRLAMLGDYVGVEPDELSRRTARSRLPARAVMLESIEQVDNRGFDLLCSFEVLEHIDDDIGELKRWLQCLKPGGLVIVSVPAHRHRFAAADAEVGHLRRYDPVDLRALLASAGLVDIQVQAYGFPLGYLLEWARNRLAARDARRLAADGPQDLRERTARSGRLRQPPSWASSAIDIATWPFRMLQRLNRNPNLGPGLIGYARAPM